MEGYTGIFSEIFQAEIHVGHCVHSIRLIYQASFLRAMWVWGQCFIIAENPLPHSNVKPTSFQDRKLSFRCFCSKKDRLYSFLKQNSRSKQNVFYPYQKILVQRLLFWSVSKIFLRHLNVFILFKKSWRNLHCFGCVLISFFKNKNVLF